jgi:metallo-beta-lactamase class B
MRKALLAAVLSAIVAAAHAQSPPANAPTKEQLANDNNLFLSLAKKVLKWEEPAEPVRLPGRSISSAPRDSARFCSRHPKGIS